MKITRSLAIALICVVIVLMVPTAAFGIAREPMPFESIIHEPLFIAVATVAGFAFLTTVIFAMVSVHVHHLSCKNQDCVYHPRGRQSLKAYDFANMETPEGLAPVYLERDKAFDAADLLPNQLVQAPAIQAEVVPAAARTAELQQDFEQQAFELVCTQDLSQPSTAASVAVAGGPRADIRVNREPYEPSTMDFTDGMIRQVVEAVWAMQQQQWQQPQLQQHWQQPLPVQQQQLTQYQLLMEARQVSVTGVQPLQECSGQQAAIDWLTEERSSRGKHFKQLSSAAPLQESSIEHLAGFNHQAFRHRREELMEEFQRVG